METKEIAIIVAALVVGMGAGVGIGYAAFHNGSSDATETYWFYVDYGDKADDSHKSDWVSVSSTTPLKAITKALDKIPGDHETDKSGNAKKIGGVGGDTGYSWMSWFYKSTKYDTTYDSKDYPNWLQTPNFEDSVSIVFFLAYTTYDSSTFEPTIDPYASGHEGWKSSGPFKTA